MLTLLFVIAAGVVCTFAGDRYHPEQYMEPRTEPVGRLLRSSETTTQFWVEDAQAALRQRHTDGLRHRSGHARNVVMFLGDGMSVPTLTAARVLLGQRQGQTGEEANLAFDKFPTTGLVKTYCVNRQVADSACSATAYLCGVKGNAGTIGVNGAVPRHDCAASTDAARRVQSIAEWALADGRDAGIVTTTRITHASPAGVYGKTANRNWETDADVVNAGHDTERCPDLAHQMIHKHPGNKFKVIFGGGRRAFLPNTTRDEEGTRGRRTDDRNLIEEWQADKAARNVSYKYIWNRAELAELASSPPEYLLGLFEGTHMRYHMEADPSTEPTLAELTEVAIRSLSRNERGFFLFVEGGRIDHAHHDNFARLALDETIEMSKAVARAAELLDEEDSLIVVTADHAHVMAFNGYSPRGQDILGTNKDRDRNGVPYMTLSYTNGPGRRVQDANDMRVDVTQEDNFGALRWRSHVDFPLSSETHGGDDVAVFARGPHHAIFTGLYEQSHIPHRMAYAACIGPGLHACSAAHSLRGSLLAALMLLPTLVAALRSFF
ncbi:hypothetical protein O3G_MSEX008023 [Manduca sexta]|uniref:Alkaline phosphatase n=1 Tax=Manduca sexta TaxID=7130 RepID=A0A921Z8Z4_MANSE|nr:hypothetical protein O3G_MSEX008023 [Manduca sexta]